MRLFVVWSISASLLASSSVFAGCDSDDSAPAGIDEKALDRSTPPCRDFYQFACGGWMRSNTLGPDEGVRATFFQPDYTMVPALRAIVEAAARDSQSPAAALSPEARLVGNHYQGCMEAPMQSTARQTLRGLALMTDSITSLEDLGRVTGELRNRGSGSLLSLGVGIDPGNPARHMVFVDQGGIELPDRSYYLDEAQALLRASYLQHITQLAALVGVSIDPQAVLRVETALAVAELAKDQRRDPTTLYHPLGYAEATALAPHFPWRQHLDALGFGAVDTINVVAPPYLAALEALLLSTPLEDLKSYVRWQIIEDKAWALDQPVLNEENAFHLRTVLGIAQPQPRWWVCYKNTTNAQGMALARLYVEKFFKPEVRQAGLSMMAALKTAFRDRLGATAWMDEPTRAEAITKLDSVTGMVGYPAMWPPSVVPPSDGTWLGQNLAANQYYYSLLPARLTQAVDRGQWLMSPIEVNAYYYSPLNEVVLTAAIFQLPFFDLRWGNASRFGAIGTVMGHELTHGFDDSGRHYDGAGVLRPWWTPAVATTFQQRTQCMVDQYGRFQPLPGQAVNGTFTLGENIADLGGLRLSHAALLAETAGMPAGLAAGLDREQQFFVSYAQMYCENVRPQLRSVQLKTDPHAPGKLRVNGPLSNLPEFAEAFHCAEGTPMRAVDRCEVW